MAMMASATSGNPYDQVDTVIEQDLLDDGKVHVRSLRVLEHCTDYRPQTH